MKRIGIMIAIAVAVLCAAVPVRGAESELFVYPTPPDTMQVLQDRSDYIVARFWDRCNFSSAFKHERQLENAFVTWVSIMPHASADTVFTAIDKLVKRFEKKGPETLALAQMADRRLYKGDSVVVASTDLYLPFARAAAASKKISKADRQYFATQAQIIESSTPGRRVPSIPVIYNDGAKGTFDDIKGGSVLIYFNDPECLDCNFARIRLSADPNTNELISRGELIVVAAYPGEPKGEQWEKAKASVPENWLSVAMPQAAEYFDMGTLPSFYFLDSRHKVLAANMDIEYILGSFQTANYLTKARIKASKQAE